MALTVAQFESNPLRQMIRDAFKNRLTPVICASNHEVQKVYTLVKQEFPTFLTVRSLDTISTEFDSKSNGGLVFEDFGRIVGDADMDLEVVSAILIPEMVPLPSLTSSTIPNCPRIVVAEQSLEHIFHRYLTKTYYNKIRYSILDELRVKLKNLYLNVKYLRIGDMNMSEEVDFSFWILDEDAKDP